MQTKGTKFSTIKPGGSIYALGHDVDLGVAKSTTSTTQTHQAETIDGEGIKLGSDNVQLGAVERIDSTDSTTTTVTTNQGTELNTDNLILLGDMKDGSLTTTAAKLNAKNLTIGAKTTVLDGIENTKDISNTNTTDTSMNYAEKTVDKNLVN